MTKTIAIVALIVFVSLLYLGLQFTAENFNSLLASDSIVFFRITPDGGNDYKFILLGEPFHISSRALNILTDPVIATWNKLIPSSGDAIINY